MLKNYFKIALRFLWHNKVYVAINLVGLAFALACCILSYINYSYRATFDENHTGTENIYRLNSVRKINGSSERWGTTPVALGEYLAKDLGADGRIVRLFSENLVVKNKEDVFGERVYYADKNIFSFFNFPLRQGNFSQFDNKNTIIISQSIAEKFYGKDEPIGKELTLVKNGKESQFTVIGLLEKIPLNSSFQFDLLCSFNNAFVAGDASATDLRSNLFVTTFAEIKNKENAQKIAGQLGSYASIFNKGNEDWKIESFYFQPFKEIALSSDVDFNQFVHGRELNSNPRGVMVIMPVIMSLLVLLITCFNFTNISIALANKRLKEIGIRKAMGVRKWQLIIQFLSENILLCFIASGLALLLVYCLLPALNSWSGIELQLNFGQNIMLWIILFAFQERNPTLSLSACQ